MSELVRVMVAAASAGAVALVTVPVAIRVAGVTGFLDRPAGHKAHAAATPYLGGLAVLCAFLPVALLLGDGAGRFAPILGSCVAMCLLGTYDDRRPMPAGLRVVAEAGIAVILWAAGLGWGLFDGDAANLVLTVLWVVALVNALNLMDNLDGAAGSVVLAAAAGIAVLALLHSAATLAAFAAALAGVCAGFLRFNLASPRARIFLGDGGSLWLGVALAASVMALPTLDGLGWPGLSVAVLLVAMPALDTALVVVSRTRRGVSLLTGGRDHLTHRIGRRFDCSPAVVATVLAGGQFAASLAAEALSRADRSSMAVALAGCVVVILALVALLERPNWRTAEPAPTLGDTAPRERRDEY